MSREEPVSAFWNDLRRDMQDPEFRAAFEQEMAKIHGMYEQANSGRVARKVAAASRRATEGLGRNPQIYSRSTKYEISIFPYESVNRRHFTISVEYRGDDKWAVMHFSDCLSTDGTWDYEMQPSARGGEWLDKNRHTLPEALRLAYDWAPRIGLGDLSAVQALAKEESRAKGE